MSPATCNTLSIFIETLFLDIPMTSCGMALLQLAGINVTNPTNLLLSSYVISMDYSDGRDSRSQDLERRITCQQLST